MSLTLVSLGDSFSCGQGVGLRVELDATWGGLLAAGLPGSDWAALAAPGARTRDVRHLQLPRAVAAQPGVATLLVGLNDVIRSGFAAEAVAADLRHIVTTLASGGCLVLVARLHDPGAVLRLAGPLRRGVSARIEAVNAAIDDICSSAGHLVLDLARVAGLSEPSSWAVDRLHPSPAGHRAMAVAAAQQLRSAGVAVQVLPAQTRDPVPGRAATLRWLVASGLPWGASHALSVGVPVLASLGRQR